MKLREIVKSTLRKLGYKIAAYTELDIDGDAEFIKIYDKCKDYTMVSRERSYALYNAIRYIVRNNIPGDFVECGVWRGGSSMIMAYTLQLEGDTSRAIWLYDTYEGMSEPSEHDVFATTGESAIKTYTKNDRSDTFWCEASIEEVQKNMEKTAYPKNALHFIKGKVEDTIPKTMPGPIALLRLDTDFYESTRHELQHLYPLLSKSGVLVIDDYGAWIGARKAVDEYVAQDGVGILLNKTHNGRIGVKI